MNFLRMILATGTVALATAAGAGPGLVVNGAARVLVAPDHVVVTLGIETYDASLPTAKRMNDDRVNAVIAAARQAGVERSDIRTDFLSISPQYKDRNDRGNLLRYLVRKSVEITLRDVSGFEDALAAFLEAGANFVHGIEFRISDIATYERQARRLALLDARGRAEAMAQELGLELGAATGVRDCRSHWRSSYARWGQRGPTQTFRGAQEIATRVADHKGPTQPGEIAVTSSVTVEYRIQEE